MLGLSYQLEKKMENELQAASGCKLIGILGSGCQSVAYRAIDETGNEKCLKMALIDESRYYARSILDNSFIGKRKFDLPIEKSGELHIEDRIVQWLVTDVATPISWREHNDILQQLADYNMVYVDPKPAQWGKVNGQIVLLDYNAVVAIEELPDELQRFCAYIKREARKYDFDSENAGVWREKMYSKLESMGYTYDSDDPNEYHFVVTSWIRCKQLYANW